MFENVFGNLTSGIIRLAVTVGVLAAVYFFIVKPILHTTEHTVDSANKSFEKAFQDSGINEINKTIENVNNRVQRQVERSFHTAKVHGEPEKLIRCIQRAHQNVHRIERCTRRY